VYNNLFTKYAINILNIIITPDDNTLKLTLLKLVIKKYASLTSNINNAIKNKIEIIKK